ncbi:MAG: SMC-Scp complex subunit ScpB [Alphaproteobacteria bacterium]|nr:SMC-Scp complex subunit ScpB [Alphaproteobacteria bacterium]
MKDHLYKLRLLEALFFTSSEPISSADIVKRFSILKDECDQLLNDLQSFYSSRGVNLVERDGYWAMRTAPDLVADLTEEIVIQRRLSKAALETLAIIAYHQPVTKTEIEQIRGVALSKGTLDMLFEIGWIEPKGRRETLGQPVIWGTTIQFYDHFGLTGKDDLPSIHELKASGLLQTGSSLTILGINNAQLPSLHKIEEEQRGDSFAHEENESF